LPEAVPVPKTPIRPAGIAYPPGLALPLSPAATADGWLFLSGCVPNDAEGRLVGPNDVAAQTEQALRNMADVLAAAGGTLADVLKCNVYLADIRTFQAMNDVFARHFPTDPPARTTVEARLGDPGWLVEISAVAFLGRG
jgi:reactive intermediate/imine deaminase